MLLAGVTEGLLRRPEAGEFGEDSSDEGVSSVILIGVAGGRRGTRQLSRRVLDMEYLLFSAKECDYVRRQMHAVKCLGMERVVRRMGKVKSQ